MRGKVEEQGNKGRDRDKDIGREAEEEIQREKIEGRYRAKSLGRRDAGIEAEGKK
jgi:hypothetical protein